MGAEDEFRKVGEDVRALARTLRHELKGAQWEAKQAARQARDEIRNEYRSYRRTGGPPRHGQRPPPQWSGYTDSLSDPRYAGGVAPPPPVWAPRPPTPPIPPKPPKPVRAPLPPVRHRRDGSTLLSLLLVLVGLAWLVSQTKLFDVSLEAVLAASLALLGAGMVVTARTDWSLSRRSWPMWAGITLLVMVMLSANSAKISNSFSSLSFGPVDVQPATWASANTTVTNFAGPIRIDLGRLPSTGPPTPATLTARDTFGPVDVTLPTDLQYRVHVVARVWAGTITLPPGSNPVEAGSNRKVVDLGPTVGPTLTLDLQTRAGPITVRQLDSPTPANIR